MLKIRLKPMGKIGKIFYRIVVVDQNKKRDGKIVDSLGYYDPNTKPVKLNIQKDKIDRWINQGALPTETARKLLNI